MVRYKTFYVAQTGGVRPAGWYVQDTSITSCVVVIGGRHATLELANEAARRA